MKSALLFIAIKMTIAIFPAKKTSASP